MLRRLFRLLVVLGVVVILAVVAVWMLTNTDWGRERVRRYAVDALQGSTHGIVKIGALHGDLLRGATLVNISITDSAGRPFLEADSLSGRYTLRSFLTKKLWLRDVVLYQPAVVVEKLPGQAWNYQLLWPQDTVRNPGDTLPGWSSSVRFENMRVLNGDVIVRSPWEPRAGLTRHVRDSVIKAALADESRLKIIRAPGGFQKVVALDSIDAILPLLRISDPAFKNRFAAVSALRMIAYPFRPPGANVTALTGNFEFNDDSLWWKGVKAQMPGSKLSGDGTYRIDNGDMKLSLAAVPASLADFRWIMPTFPKSGGGKLGMSIQWKGATQDYVIRDADVRTEGAHLLGDLGFTLTDTIFFHDADVRFAGLTFKLINEVFPGTGTPRPGVLTGSAKFAGTLKRMKIDRSDVTYDAYGRGRNRFLASGIVGFRGKPTIVSAANLRVRMAPLQIDLVKLLFPTLPIGGTLSGVATLNGDGATQLVATGLDIVHQDGPNRSHAVGRASVHTTGRQTLDLDVQAQPIALAELNKFAPALGLKGYASGPVHAHGPIDAMAVDTRLALPGGATFALRGTVDFLSKELGYDVVADATALDLSRVMVSAPVTSLTGGGTARGRGFKPATMYSDLDFRFGPSSVDTIGVDSLSVRARLANGLATVAQARVRGSGAVADLSGAFGLDARHSGTLTYNVAVDSLGTFARFIPGTTADTGVVPPRPRLTAERLARARADSARADRATEVARAISGLPPARVQVDTPKAIPRGLLAGTVRAAGSIAGNIQRFSLHGTANAVGLVVKGNAARHLNTTYSWIDARTRTSKLSVALAADTVSAYGFAFDSLAGDLSYLGPNGTVAVRVKQGADRDYGLRGEFTLDKARNELRLAEVALRFDSTTWSSTHPAIVRWGPPGVEVVNLELRSAGARRIYANGLLPTQGRANFDLSVTDFDAEEVTELLQSDVPLVGRISLDAHVEGTATDPRMKGRLDLVAARYNGSTVPDVHGTFEYANRQLTTNAVAQDSTGRLLATVNGMIPIDLALSGVTGSRLLDAPINVTVGSDSLPIYLIPQFTDVVSNVAGRAMGNVKVGGTLKKPVLQGSLTLADAQFKLEPTGVLYQHVSGSVRMTGDTVYVDSIVAVAIGPVRVTGTVAVGNFREPAFDLALTANDAQLLNNDRGEVHADAGLRIAGPLNQVYVSGQVTVLHGVFYIPPSSGKKLVGAGDPALFNVIDTAVVAQREIFPAQSPLFKNLRVDVDLVVDRNTWVRSREANVELFTDGPMRVAVVGDALTLSGAVDADRGEYTFLSKRFQITRGSALFIGTPDLNPTLQVTAEYQVRQPTSGTNTNIKVLIGGTLQRPRISLESDAQPPLSQSELLSYLAFGDQTGSLASATPGSLIGGGQGGNIVSAAGSRLAGIAVGVALDEVEGDAARSLGVDVFNVTPGSIAFTGSTGGNFLRGTELEMGKYISPTTFGSIVAAPGTFACLSRGKGENSACVTPGLTLTHRSNKGYRFETSYTPQYFLNPPSLAGQTAGGGAKFGAFVIREWRF
jgi:translocation and assembly module TamB